MSDEGRTRLQEPELDVIEHEDLAGLQLSVLEREDYVLRRLLEADPASARLSFGLGNDAQQTVRGDPRDPFNGIAVMNYGTASVAVAFGAGNANAAPLFTAPPQSLIVLPGRFADICLGVDNAGAQVPAFPVNVWRLRIAPLSPYIGTIPSAQGVASAVDVTDRSARILGTTDVSDRAGRLLGQITAAVGAAFDVSDRAARALGVADISDRAARALGVADISDRAARLLGVADISDRKTRQNGIVRQDQQWSLFHTPAANVQATVTKPAGGAGVVHVCTGIIANFFISSTPALNGVLVLRDGASGAGPILFQTVMSAWGAFVDDHVTLTGLQIPGSANTAMTLEFTTAPGGVQGFEGVNLLGYDA